MSIPVISYFSGGGFLDLGFELEDFEVVWSNEISTDISKIYNSGLSSALKKTMRISSNESIESIKTSFLKKNVIKKLDLKLWGIIGGPPCPDFSVGGKNRGKDGERGKLSKIYVDHICSLKPSFFVFENVKGLVKTKKHREFFDELVRQLEDNGYATDYRTLNALDFGVPQDRERIILLGIRKGLYKSLFSKQFSGEKEWYPWPKAIYPNAKESYDWDNLNSPDLPDELKVGSYIMNQDELSHLANSNEYFVPKSPKFNKIEEGDTSRKSFKRLHRNKYSPTAAYGNNEVHLHPTLGRRLSVREALRIQTVPDSYVIDTSITLSTKFKVIGNGVPVKLSRAIAESMRLLLSRLNK